MKYFDELKRAMDFLAEKENTVFIGQAVEYAGTAMSNTLKEVPRVKLLEMPVAEEFQMGITVGMALDGKIPISIFPRWNFLLLGVNQLVNHLDKISEYSHGEFKPKAIIRTGIGSERPLHPQAQHVGDFTEAFQLMLKNVDVIRLTEPDEIFDAYRFAYERTDGRSTVLVEYGDFYSEK
jgi:pyruvate/2-oxoglutarate/acetoin dehydrogenase E1 component